MSSDKKPFRAARLLLLAAPVALAACSADLGPSPMPTGYKFLNKSYSVPGGPAPVMHYPGENGPAAATVQDTQPSSGDTSIAAPMPMVGQAEPVDMAAPDAVSAPVTDGAAVAVGSVQWDSAANDLLGKLESAFGTIRESVYTREPNAGRADEAAFAQALKQAMEVRKYKAGDKDKAAFAFDYTIAGQADGATLVSLNASAQGKLLARVEGRYAAGLAGSASAAPEPGMKMEKSAAASPADPDKAVIKTAKPDDAAIPVMGLPEEQPVAKPDVTAARSVSQATTGDSANEPPPALTVDGADTVSPQTASESAHTYIYGRGQGGSGKTAYEERADRTGAIIAAPSEDEGDSSQ